jgi:hypothetical protein
MPPATKMREDIERTGFSDSDQFEAMSRAARCGGAHRLVLLSHRLPHEVQVFSLTWAQVDSDLSPRENALRWNSC